MDIRFDKLFLLGLLGAGLGAFRLAAQAPDASSFDKAKTDPVQSERPTGDSAPVDQMTLAAGDLIDVNILGEPDLSGKFRVSQNGDILLGVGGPIQVGGLSADDAAAAIEKRLTDSQLLREPHVTVFVEEYASAGVSVLGDVKSPGVYPMFGKHTLYDALALAGGLSATAANEVTIIHHDDPQHPQLVTMTNSPQQMAQPDVPVMPGDKIIASSAGVVYALGEVGRPGGFVLARNEPTYTVTKVLALAQGFTHVAKLNSAIVIRKTDHGVEQYAFAIPKVLEGKEPDIQLQAGDIVFVPSSTVKLLSYRALEAVFTTVTGLVTYGKL